MKRTEDEARNFTTITEVANPKQLTEELTASVEGALASMTQSVRDYDTAFALWPGQTDDGRQWDKHKGANQAFPWDGAADSRNFLADGLITEQVRIMMAAVRRARLQASALRPLQGTASAKSVTTLLTWMFENHLAGMLAKQLAICARWRQQYGFSIVGAWWEEKPRLVWTPFRLQDLLDSGKKAAEELGDKSLLDLGEMLLDPTRDAQALQALMGLSPVMKQGGARKALREIREKGETKFPNVEVISSLPKWRALRAWVDVFFPARMESIEDTRWIARRQWLTEAQIREVALANDWDMDWVEDICAHGRGQTFDAQAREKVRSNPGSKTAVQRAPWEDPAELKHLIEVVWFYTVGTHDEHKLPVMYLTVFCPMRPENEAGKEQVGFHGPMPDDSGEYPFALFVREHVEQIAAESRSVCQVSQSWQEELKHERDAAINRAHITNIPPLVTGGHLGKTRLELGPGSQLAEKRGENIRWLSLPAQASDSAAVVNRVERECDRYFARISEHVPTQAWQLMLEDLAGNFLLECKRLFQLSLAHAQQYLPPTTAQRIADDPTSIFHVSREDIRGRYDVKLVFNPQDLDFEQAIARLKAFKELIIASDRTGAINNQKFIEAGANMLDPELARGMVQAPEQAAEKQRGKVRAAWQSILAGIEPDIQPVGNEDYQLQLAELENILANPANAERLKNQPDSAMLFQRFVQHLQFGGQQHQNASTGLTGVKPIEWNQPQ